MGAREHIAFLAGSENRVRVLEALRERPYRQSELTERCGVSRSTAHRILGGLSERDWVRKDDGQYRTTAGGEFVLDRYETLEAAIERVEERGSFLNRLGGLATTLPPAALGEATVVSTTPEDPQAAIGYLAETIATATAETFYAISPIVSPMLNEAAWGLIEAGAHMELLIDTSVLDASRVAYPAALEDAYRIENFELYVHPGDLDFSLTILDGRVLVGAFDERGILRECLDGTDEALVEWATTVYEDHRAAAERADAIARSD